MPTETNVQFPNEVNEVRIPEQKEFDGIPFPLVLSPADNFKDKDVDFWRQWVRDNLESVEKLIVKYGAILFRDFPLEVPKDFDDFAKAFGYNEFPYIGGFGVRAHVVGNVFTSNESPPEAIIPFHHEIAHVRDYPLILFFYCEYPAKQGGETPVLLSNVLYRKMAELEPELVRRLEKEALRYIRNAPDGDVVSSALGRGWQSTFFATDKKDAERKAKAAGYDFEWLENGCMKTITQELPPIRIDKRTGKKMWFNSIYTAFKAWKDARNDNTKSVIFSNGEYVPFSCMPSLEKAIQEAGVSVKYQPRDLLMIDNRTVQHARADFVPPRRILASLYADQQGVLSFLE